MRELAKFAYCSYFLLFLLAVTVTGRHLPYSASELVSDGVSDHVEEEESSFLHLKGMDSSEEYCEKMYGFLPCSESLLGHLFLIVVYEFLLFHGESYVASGGKRIFKILGPGIFGASAFQVLGSLPESLILLASGLLNSKEMAQEYVLTGVGLLGGSTVFLLTLLWGTCVIIGSQDFSSDSNSSPSSSSIPVKKQYLKFLSLLTGFGVTTDPETSSNARIMVLSIIPFIIILIPKIVGVAYSPQGYIFLVTLTVSVTFLLVYFVYQMFEPSIQKRRLKYVKHEHLVVDILKHLQEHTMGKVLNEDGAANVPAIKSLFQKIDQDGDNYVSFHELKELLQDIKFRKLTWDKEKTIEEVMKEFDCDANEKITVDEFVGRFTKWVDETKSAVNKPYRSIRSWKDLYQIVQPWIQTKKKEEEMMKVVVSEIIRHVQSSPLGNFYMEDGSPDVSAIKRLFESIDLDKDNCISQSELRQLIMDVNVQNISFDVDQAVETIMEDLDKSGDQQIDEEEFISGFQQWLNTSNYEDPNSPGQNDDVNEQSWEKWIDDEKMDRSIWARAKAIMLLVLGIAMLAVLAEPLIHSVQKLSTSVNVPSFFVSFILVPMATNTRAAISAIKTASQKKQQTTSLTFSEIYDAVFMNNALGFSVLLSVVYFRGLTWDFSAEVLIVLIVCVIVGVTASFRSKFPVWTSFVAFLLYPLSLIFVYVFDQFFWLSGDLEWLY